MRFPAVSYFGSRRYTIFSRIAHLSDNPVENEKGTNHTLDDLSLFADQTGLEPATSAVTGRHSNQLNY